MKENLIVGSATRVVAGVDERFLHWLLFGLIMATLVSGVMATGTALMTLF
jgi:hypothetical protein